MAFRRSYEQKETGTEHDVTAAIDAFSDERLRWLIGKGDILVQKGVLDESRLETLINTTVKDEVERSSIEHVLSDAPATISKISRALKLDKECVLWHLLAMMKWGRVEIVGEEKNEYVYAFVRQ